MNFRILAVVALALIGALSTGGCVVQEHRDGGVTIRPMH
jgi:hypothetical protein